MKENKMGFVPIPKLIATMSLPVIFSMLVQALYNVVDSVYVSKISEDALTAVSLAFPIQMIIVACFVGLGTGINSTISRKLGAKDKESAVLTAEHGVFIGIILYVIIAIIGFFISRYFFQAFTENKVIVGYSSIYISIVMSLSFGSILTHAGMSILQGTGEMVKPMIAQLIGAITNIILDPIFIFGYFGLPAMGVKGAAVATVTAQIIAMIYIWVELLKGNNVLKPNLKGFRFKGHIVKQIVSVGLPSSIMQGLASVMLTAMNFILSAFGDTAIAVMGIYFRAQSMVFMPIFGLSIGTMPIVGYNFGAKNKERIIAAIKFSTTVAVCFMSLCFIIFQLIPDKIIGLFTPTAGMIEIGIPAFRIISFLFPIVAVTIILSTAFQALGKAYYSMIISIIRQLAILIPTAFILTNIIGVRGVWYAFLIAEIVSIFIALYIFSTVYRKDIKNLGEENN